MQSLQSSLAELQGRVASTEPPAPAAPPPRGNATSSPPSRADLVQKLKRYEAMLEIYKEDETDPERLAIVQKVTAVKAELAALKPLGAQLDGARQALQRAAARREEAEKALAAAQLLRDTAVAEEETAKAEVAALETMVVPPEAQTDIMDSIQVQLDQLVKAVRDDPHVPREHVSNAEKHVRDLIVGFTTVLRQAKDAKAWAARTPPTRLHGKTPLPEIPVHRVRNVRKQPQKFVPDNVFIPTRRNPVRSRSRARCASADL